MLFIDRHARCVSSLGMIIRGWTPIGAPSQMRSFLRCVRSESNVRWCVFATVPRVEKRAFRARSSLQKRIHLFRELLQPRFSCFSTNYPNYPAISHCSSSPQSFSAKSSPRRKGDREASRRPFPLHPKQKRVETAAYGGARGKSYRRDRSRQSPRGCGCRMFDAGHVDRANFLSKYRYNWYYSTSDISYISTINKNENARISSR